MSEHIIVPRPTFRETVKSFSPQVKQALIGGSVAIILGMFAGIGKIISMYSENSHLKVENSRLNARVHEQEMEYLPFRNLSVQRYNKDDAESLKKLAESMKSLHYDYSNALTTISRQQAELERLKWKTERAVSPETEAEIISQFTKLPKAKIGIKCYDTTSESERFTQQLFRIFIKSGFDTTNYVMNGRYEVGMALAAGHYMTVNSTTNFPACANPMRQLFERAGIDFAGSVHPNLATNEIEFVIMRISR